MPVFYRILEGKVLIPVDASFEVQNDSSNVVLMSQGNKFVIGDTLVYVYDKWFYNLFLQINVFIS